MKILAPAVLAALALAGCSALPSTGDKGFVTGDGSVRAVPTAERGAAVQLAGTDLDGRRLDLASLRGASREHDRQHQDRCKNKH